MNDFVKLFKVLNKNSRASGAEYNEKGRKKLSQSAIMTLSMLPLAVLFCVMLAFLGLRLQNAEQLMSMLTSLLSGVQVMLLFLMLTSILNTLYKSPDNNFLASLPMRPASVFFAKFSMVYVGALKFSAVFILPTMLTLSITYAASGHNLFPGFYPLVLVIWLAAPLLPLFIVTLLSMPFMWLSSFFKGRAGLKTIITIVFYIALMALYMLVVFSFSSMGESDSLSPAFTSALSKIATVMYPNKVLLMFTLGMNAGVNFGIFAAIAVGIALLSALLSMLFYRRITEKQGEGRVSVSKTAVSYKQNSIRVALIKKDFKNLSRNPSLAIGTFGNIILAPMFLLIFYFTGTDFSAGESGALTAELGPLGFIMFYSLIFFGGANMLSLMAFSMEGTSFFNSRPLPIRAKDAIIAKLTLSLIIPAVCALIIMLIGGLLYKISALSIVLYAPCVFLFAVGLNSVNIILDMKGGNVHWKEKSEMKNQNPMALMSVFAALVPGLAFMIMGFVLGGLEETLGRAGVLGIFWGVGFLLALITAFIGVYLLKEKGEALYAKIGDKKSSPIKPSRGKFDNMLG